jgi:hypothetical protein
VRDPQIMAAMERAGGRPVTLVRACTGAPMGYCWDTTSDADAPDDGIIWTEPTDHLPLAQLLDRVIADVEELERRTQDSWGGAHGEGFYDLSEALLYLRVAKRRLAGRR